MHWPKSRAEVLHLGYEIGIWFKGIDGILEVIGGLLLLLLSRAALNSLVVLLTQHELVEDPNDWLATHLRQAVSHLSSDTKLFGSAYLLGHGAIKIILVWVGLMRQRRWAFPAALLFLSGFIAYQSWRLGHHFSLMLALLTGLDVLIALLIWREWRLLPKRQRTLLNASPALR